MRSGGACRRPTISDRPRRWVIVRWPNGNGRVPSMPNVLVNDCRLWFVIEGPQDGPPLLLSNALGTTAAFWEDQAAAFAHTFRVIRYDTRGHGRSDAPAGDYTIEQLGRDA